MTPVECELSRLVINQNNESPQMVMLREKGGNRVLPIMIGFLEAFAISRALSDEPFPRPLTPNLFCNTVEALGCRLLRITVNDLRDSTFFGLLTLEKEGGETVEIDARPSDAIALAVCAGCPVFVADHVLDAVTDTPE